MFMLLMLVTFIIAFVVSFIVVKIFSPSLIKILTRIIADEISMAWVKYMQFALYVVGISSGVRIWELKRYITPTMIDGERQMLELTNERWVLEVYGTIIGTIQGMAWVLLIFFVFALLAFVIVKSVETKKSMKS